MIAQKINKNVKLLKRMKVFKIKRNNRYITIQKTKKKKNKKKMKFKKIRMNFYHLKNTRTKSWKTKIIKNRFE